MRTKKYIKPSCYSINADMIVPIAATTLNKDGKPVTLSGDADQNTGFRSKDASYNAWDEELEDGFHQEDWRFRYKDAE